MGTRAGLVEYMLPFIFLATFTTGLIFYYHDSGFIAINIVIPVIISWIAGTFASLYKYREACKLSDNTKDITNSEYQKEVEKLELSHKENLAISEQRAREKVINENKKEIDKIRLQNAQTEESLLNQLAEEQKESKELKAKNETITAENTMLKKSCSTLQDKKEKLQSEIENLQTMCMKYRQDQEANKDEFRKELTALRKTHKKDMEHKEDSHRAKIQRIEKEITKNLTSDYEGRIERLRDSHKATVDKIRRFKSSDFEKLQNELKAKLKNLESELASSRNEQILLNEKLHSQQQQHHEFAYSSLVEAHGRQSDDRDHSSRQHQQILLTHKANMDEQKTFFQSQIEHLSENHK